MNKDDLETEFMIQYGDIITSYESKMVDLLHDARGANELQEWLDTLDKLKAFCEQHGIGGKTYYNSMWKGLSLITEIKSEMQYFKKYPQGINVDSVIIEVYKLFEKHSQLTTTQIYKLCGLCFGAHIRTAIKVLSRVKAIVKDIDDDNQTYYRINE